MSFRKILFWVHLIAGVISGLSIGIMSFTGAALAFEKDLVSWSQRDARRVSLPDSSSRTRLPLDELQRKLRETHPEARPASIVVQNDPAAAVAFSIGRTGAYYVNPYTGDVRQPQSSAVADFMHTMVDWHRYLGRHGEESRPVGKLINGICNVAFCLLALTGLYLWMPRQWSWRALRPIVWFRQNSNSKARDFNWHNVIGFWSAPVLIVLTLTAMPISFRWAGNLIYTLTGSEAPAAPTSGPGATASPAVEVPVPPPGAKPLPIDALLARAQHHLPAWETITLRIGNASPRGGQASASANPAPRGNAPEVSASNSRESGRVRLSAVSFTVREANTWPRTATTTLTLDPFTASVLRQEGYADLPAARQVRSWTRFLHTGEAVGWFGQLVAGIASLGGVFLVWTGFALAWRRFLSFRASSDPVPELESAARSVER